MTTPETFESDLDRVARGEPPVVTADTEHAELIATAQRISEGMRMLREASPDVRERIETRLLAQLPAASRRRGIHVAWLRPIRRWQAIVGLATAAALILVVVGGIFPWNGSSEAVNAQVILDRAEAATTNAVPTGVTSYHLKATRHVPAKGNATLTQETWYAGRDRQRVDMQIKDENGVVVTTSSTVFNGAETWDASTKANGQTRVIHTTGADWTKPAELPSGEGVTSIADLIAQYGSSKACMNAQQQGEATVAGRASYVIHLTPKPDRCPGQVPDKGSDGEVDGKATTAATAKADQAQASAAAGKRTGQDNTVGQVTIWVDKQTFLPLKNEYRNPQGAVLDSYEVTSVEFNTPIPASVFAYTPPAGANVLTFNGVKPQDVKATIGASESITKGTPVPRRP